MCSYKLVAEIEMTWLRAVVDRAESSAATNLLAPFRQMNASGLSDVECDAVREATFRLMVDGRLVAVGEQRNDDGHLYAYVFGADDELYTVGRHGGVYFILNAGMGICAVSRRFSEILDALGRHVQAHAEQERIENSERTATELSDPSASSLE